ncbi:MAG: DUF190 domain-containing protein [Blastocatellia bacterium]|nr:DUF190 domain-containing protein [Blastocatellia bacterium]
MKRLLLLGSIWVLLAGCESGQNAASAPAPTPQAEPGVVIIPPDSPKLAQLRVEPIKLEARPAGEVTAPGKVEVNLNRISRAPLPVAGRVMNVIDTEEKIRSALPALREMVGEGLVAMTDVEVLHHASGEAKK